jgi:hypothetical protein
MESYLPSSLQKAKQASRLHQIEEREVKITTLKRRYDGEETDEELGRVQEGKRFRPKDDSIMTEETE